MQSQVLQFLFLIVLSTTTTTVNSAQICDGQQLSAFNDSQVEELHELVKRGKEPLCTHVLGDIIFQNLSSVVIPTELYKHIRFIQGSIIILNNTNIENPIEFPSLRSINASLLPAIVVVGNGNVLLQIGSYFKKARTQAPNGMMFAVLMNKNFVLDTAQYNLWYFAGYPNSKFVTDSLLRVKVCSENLFKPIAGALGFLFVALTVAFSTVAFYDRKKHL